MSASLKPNDLALFRNSARSNATKSTALLTTSSRFTNPPPKRLAILVACVAVRVGDSADRQRLNEAVQDFRACEHALGTRGPKLLPAAAEHRAEGSQHGQVAAAPGGRRRFVGAADKLAASVEVVRLEGDKLEAVEGRGDDPEELACDGGADAPEDC